MPIHVIDPGGGPSWTDGTGQAGGGVGSGGGGTNYADASTPETGTVQVLLGEGRMQGLVSYNGLGTDYLRSVYLDGTPIQNSDGTFNFKGVALALVAGTNTQPAIKGITDTESETSVNVQVVQASPVTRSITSAPSAVRVRISIPTLEVVDSSTGKISGNSVTIKIEKQNALFNGAAWFTEPLENTGLITGGPFTSKYTKSYRIDLPATGTWQIRVTRVSADDPDGYHASQTWWDAYTEIVDASLRYPNSAVLSVRVNAKQFQNIPQVTCLMNMTRIMVPANYTPASYNFNTGVWTGAVYRTTGTGTSGGVWDGTFVEAWSSNPAWVFYDAASKTRYGAGTFLQTSGLDKWTLYSIGQWCDAIVGGTYAGVSDGKGGLEPRMVANLYIQAQQNAITALSQLCAIFWGVVYYASGLVTPVADADQSPVALFTNSNVEGGKFNYEGTARQARHTAAICKFNNLELGYDSDTAVYEDEVGVARYGYNVLDLQAIGCTSQSQAMRLAKWAILTELMASETCSFSSGLEGSTVHPGDVIQVADQFRAGNSRAGGRIISATNTTNATVTLDAPVTLGAGTYTLRVQTATGGMESKTVTTTAGTYSTLTVSGVFTSLPVAGAGWLLQAGTTASLWRVVSVTKGDGLKYSITALLHDPSKYTALGLSTGDVVARTPVANTSPAPVGLTISNSVRVLNDRHVQTLTAAWTLDKAAGYIAQASRDYGPWTDMVVTGASALLDDIQPGSYRVQVCGDWRAGGLSPYVSASATVTASTLQPPFVGNINSVDYLAVIDQITVLRDWNNEANVKSQLDSQATALSITTEKTTYDNAVAALSTNLISAGAPAGWASGSWPSSVFGPVTNIMLSLAGWWATIATARTALINKIAVATGAAGGTTANWGSISGASAQASPAGGWTGAAKWGTKNVLWSDASSLTYLYSSGSGGGIYLRNAADTASLLAITDAGAATFSSSVTMGALTATRSDGNWEVIKATTTGAGNGSLLRFTHANSPANGYDIGAFGGTDQFVVRRNASIILQTFAGTNNWDFVSNSVSMGALTATTGVFSGQIQSASARYTGYDLNTPGNFQIFDTYAPTNAVPALAGSWHSVMTWPTADSGYVFQLANGMVNANASLYYRNKMGGTWGSWSTLYSTSNMITSMNSLVAVTGMTKIPVVCTIATKPAANAVPTNSWCFVINDTTYDPDGSMYQSNGSSWINGQKGYQTIGAVAAGSISAGALSAYVALVQNVISSSVFSSGGAGFSVNGSAVPGNNSGTPVGWAIYSTAQSSKYADGTTDTVIAEFGGNVSIGGYKAAVIANRVMGNTPIFSTPGTTTWTCPEGITSVELLIVGGGGGGGGSVTNNRGGGGGGGGQAFKGRITVVPATVYTIVVGTAGTAGATGGGAGGAGGSSSMSGSGFTTITMAGGAGGVGGNGGNSGGGTVAPTLGSGTDAPAGTYGTTFDAGSYASGGPGGGAANIGLASPPAGAGGWCWDYNGGSRTPTSNVVVGGGGGGGSVMAPGGNSAAPGNAGLYGSGGAGASGTSTTQSAGGAGGAGYVRIKY